MSRGNSFGKLFTLSSFGESHGEAMGVIIDGCPAQLTVDLEKLQHYLNRRSPGYLPGTSARVEPDRAQILSGVFAGQTLGTPICLLFANEGQQSADYSSWQNEYRAGHADRTTELKYGIRDYRGGGRSSGRETIARVAAGYFAGLILKEVTIFSYVSELGPFKAENHDFRSDLPLNSYHFPDPEINQEMETFLLQAKAEGESYGGKIQTIVKNVMPGLGEPAFDKLKADLAKAMLSIGACTGIQFGRVKDFAKMKGSEVSHSSHFFGGIEGGISNGEDIIFECTFKPSSTVGQKAREGRHDPCIVPRAVVVVESMCAVVLADHFLRQKAYE